MRSGFPLDELNQRGNFVSLLHYFGLLSIREVRDGMPRLGIPNQTVRRLMYGYLRDGCRDVGVFSVDLHSVQPGWCTRWPTAAPGGRCWSS